MRRRRRIRLKPPHNPTAQPIVRRLPDNPSRSRGRKPIAEEPFFRAAKPSFDKLRTALSHVEGPERRADSPAPASQAPNSHCFDDSYNALSSHRPAIQPAYSAS